MVLLIFLDEANEEAAYNQHRELNKSAQIGPHQELKKKKRKHRYVSIKNLFILNF